MHHAWIRGPPYGRLDEASPSPIARLLLFHLLEIDSAENSWVLLPSFLTLDFLSPSTVFPSCRYLPVFSCCTRAQPL